MRPRALVIACVLALAPTARADHKVEAKEHVQRAATAHKQGRFTDALKELSIAYSLDPQPDLLFAIGQVHMKLGDCESATLYYHRFLDSKPDPGEVKVVEKAIATCKDNAPARSAPVAPVEPPRPVEPPKPVEAPPPPAEPPHVVDHPSRRVWYRDWIGDGLVGAGIVSGAIAIVEYRATAASRNSADTAATYDAFQTALDNAHRERGYAIGFGAGAAVLVGAGVVHYVLGGRSEERAVAVVPVAGGSIVTWGGSL